MIREPARAPRLAIAILLAAGPTACGGEAVIDGSDRGGAGSGGVSSSSGSGGATTSSTTSSTTSTSTTSGPCECSTDQDCPEIDDACFYYVCSDCSCVPVPEPPGVPCMAGVCDGNESCVECIDAGDCFAPELCLDNACVPPAGAICDGFCSQLDLCMGPNPECLGGCTQDLADCSGAQLDQLTSCSTWLDQCDVMAFGDCIVAVGCASG